MSKNPCFNLNIALNNDVGPLSLDELNSKLLYSLRKITEINVDNYEAVLRFKKNFDFFEAFIEIDLIPSEDVIQEEPDEFAEASDEEPIYTSITILVDVNDVKLSDIETVLTRIQTFILNEMINKMKQELTVYPDVKNEDVTIHFKESPNVLKSLKGFDIKEIVGNYEDIRIKVFGNKLVVSGDIKNGTIVKIDNLIRANLAD